MKTLLIGWLCATALIAQNYPGNQRKNISVAVANGGRPLAAAATEIDRGADYPSVIHLKGDVEIRMPVCVVTSPGGVQHCSGEIIFRADEADIREDTGQIEAKGVVRVARK